MIKVNGINTASRNKFNRSLKGLEATMEYPYGNDFFKIDHGDSYFTFFDRLGNSFFNVALDGQEVIACGCGIIRSIRQNGQSKKIWYLCDLKVHYDYRKRGIPKKIFKKNLLLNYLRCSRGYTVSMNPSEGKNRVIDIIERFPLVPLRFATTLCFFEVSKSEVMSVEREVNKIIDEPVRFLSLKGIKDIVLKSTGEPMPLYHAQYGPMAAPNARKVEHEGRYMFCAPKNSSLCNFLKKQFSISATASVLEHGLKDQSWNFILSSDI